MAYFKELIGFLALIAAVGASQYTSYKPAFFQHSHHSHGKPHHKDVELHKLCSWNVVEFDSCKLKGDAWHPLKLDAGRNYIPENNIPTGFQISTDRRVFVSLARQRTGVYATLAYFNLDDVRDGCCPPLKAYPSDEFNSLDADCCNAGSLVNVERFNIDRCNRLWVVDRQGLNLNDRNWVLGSPKLVVFDLKSDKVIREAQIPSQYYGSHQFGLDTAIVNSDPKDCENSFAYIADTWNGCLVVYSYKQNKFWRHCSPQFNNDAKYTKFTIKTRKNKEVTYYRDLMVFDCCRDNTRREAVCHSVSSLDEFTVPFAELENEGVARCSPDSLTVKFLGQKPENAQTGTHVLNTDNQVVWGVHELQYGAACWNRENKLEPSAVKVVVSDRDRLPFVADLVVTKVDLAPFCKSHGYHADETYVALLSTNAVSINAYGFDHKEENFGIYFFRESEALAAFPQCLPDKHKHSSYDRDDKYSHHGSSNKHSSSYDRDDKYSHYDSKHSSYDRDDKYSHHQSPKKHSYDHDCDSNEKHSHYDSHKKYSHFDAPASSKSPHYVFPVKTYGHETNKHSTALQYHYRYKKSQETALESPKEE